MVKVEEGPRYVCGGVKVNGAQKVPAAAIIERLTSSHGSTQSAQRAFEFKDKAPATNPLTQALADESEPVRRSGSKESPRRSRMLTSSTSRSR